MISLSLLIRIDFYFGTSNALDEHRGSRNPFIVCRAVHMCFKAVRFSFLYSSSLVHGY